MRYPVVRDIIKQCAANYPKSEAGNFATKQRHDVIPFKPFLIYILNKIKEHNQVYFEVNGLQFCSIRCIEQYKKAPGF